MKTKSLCLIWLVLFTTSAYSYQWGKLSFSLQERYRIVMWDNTVSLDEGAADVSAFTRHRTNLCFGYQPMQNIEIALQFTNEFRKYISPKNRAFTIHEWVIDQLYVKMNKPGNLPFNVTLGRQNIILGEGFVVIEGNPLDGSRTIYFNAARFDIIPNDQHQLTLAIVYNQAIDSLLPIIMDQDQALSDQDETGAIAYYQGKFNGQTAEAYYIMKQNKEMNSRPEQTLHTIGARGLFNLLDKKLSAQGEFALQFGKQAETDRSGWGGNFYVKYTLPSKELTFLDYFKLGSVMLSGDDADTGDKIEGWDPLFARFPKWSESYIYTQIKECGVANWTNFQSFYAHLSLRFSNDITWLWGYQLLGAFEKMPVIAGFNGSGTKRGTLIQTNLEYKMNQYLSMHAIWEHFNPDDYYFAEANAATWIRFQLLLNLK